MLLRGVVLIIFLPLFTACIPPGEAAERTAVTVALGDSTTQRIITLQNRRRSEDLLPYLGHVELRYRYLAARAFGSFPSLSAPVADSLASLLTDPSEAVRVQAAYALGQSGRMEQAGRLMAAFDQSGKYVAANAAILEAVGKVGDLATAELLAGITTYTARDTLLLTGRTYGMLYAALRGLRSPATDAAAIDLALDAAVPDAARHPAAQYLQRIDFRPDSSQERRLRDVLRTTADPLLAMGVIRSLGRSAGAPARVALLRRLEARPDWRERVEILRALAGFDYASVRESVVESLRDPHPLVARTAAEYLVEHGNPADAPLYVELAADLPAPVAIPLYRAANRHLSPFLTDYRSRITGALRERYATTTDAYARADLLLALAESPWMYRELHAYYREATDAVTRTAAAEALRMIGAREDFAVFFRGSQQRVRAELAGYYRELIEGREEGPAYHAALALEAQPATYQAIYGDLAWLDTALDGFDLPRQLEPYTEVLSARNALVGQERESPATTPRGVRSADWALLREAGDRRVVLTTPQGTITLRLWPTVAPATVTSFLTLIQEGYYDGKTFHRVVPNFVAQGGGPRGDGFGSEDFVLPTETPHLHWDRAGLVGMASAGRDTEGVQFFITHRPTPHLDGKYTIFGEVVEGQEVVDRLVPGSRIESVTVQ